MYASSRFFLAVFFIAAFCACTPQTPGHSTGRVRPLNALSLEQLRVMLKGFPGDWRKDAEQYAALPEPASSKPVPEGTRLVSLPIPGLVHSGGIGGMSVRQAIARRRSVRDFSQNPLSLDELGFLLWATQGITAVERDPEGHPLHLHRAAPSAGARYPLETYLVVQRVKGLTPGIYRYLPHSHQVALLRKDPEAGTHLSGICYGTDSIRKAAAIFVWCAVPYRTEWKYGYLAHRMIAMEVGHVCQNLYLSAGASGSGVCALLAYDQTRLDSFLGVDGKDEFALYLACVGKPVRSAE